MLSVIIPTRTDAYLQKTVDDLAAKAQGEIEILVVTDGYTPRLIPNAKTRVIALPRMGMRMCINWGMAEAVGEYVLKLDEHCMVDSGFDVKLAADCEPDWLVTPRRYRLDPEAWKIIQDGRPPVDYMYIEQKGGYLHGHLWELAPLRAGGSANR